MIKRSWNDPLFNFNSYENKKRLCPKCKAYVTHYYSHLDKKTCCPLCKYEASINDSNPKTNMGN